MATLVFNAEEIAPRELKPELYELEGISRESVEAHYKLYEGYVSKRNEILAKLADVDLSAGNQVYSEVRADQHPIALITGRDVVQALRAAGHARPFQDRDHGVRPRIWKGRCMLRVAQRVASVMSRRPARCRAPMARLRRPAMTRGPERVWAREWSSR